MAKPSKQRKRSSLVWKFFEFKDDGQNKMCHCKHCIATIKFSGNTSNMLTHMTKNHKELLTNSLKKQPKINISFAKSKKEILDLELAILFSTKCLPLSYAESNEFKRFMSCTVPGYQLPSVKTLKANHINPLAKQIREKITEQIKDAKFSLTTDLWTNIKQESFLGLTCHYLHESKKKNVTLECQHFQGAHDNKNIREEVSQTFQRINNYKLLIKPFDFIFALI